MAVSRPKPSEKKKKLDELYKVVCCWLCVDEATRKIIWEAMEKYTLLVNLLTERVAQLPEFEQWRQQGWVPEKAVMGMCQALKQEEQFKGLPSRFYMSAQSMVKDTLDGWLKLQQRLSRKINGKKRWLKLVEEDIELATVTDFDPEVIQNRAKEILLELSQPENSEPQLSESLEEAPDESQQEDGSRDGQQSPFSLLFDLYEIAEDCLSRRAIVHLLKNGGEVNEETEDLEKLTQKLATKREAIQRLEKQLVSRLPKGRDPTGEQALQFLQEAIQFPEHSNRYPSLFLFDIFYHYASLPMPYVQYAAYLLQAILAESKIVESEYLEWQGAMTERFHNAAKIPNSLPYPLLFGSTDDLYWSLESRGGSQQNSQPGKPCKGAKSRKRPSKRQRKKLKTRSEERICVRFKGLGNYVFKIYCDRRQLPIFRLFATDWLTYKELDKDSKYSLGLFALRSAKLIWKEDEQLLYKKGKSKQANSGSTGISSELEALPPWKAHRLCLHCSIDPALLTAEGTERVRSRKLSETKKTLDKAREKEQKLLVQISEVELAEEEKQKLENELAKRRSRILSYETSLIQLNNSPPRPSKVPYQGEANITLGISFCRQELVGVAVVDLQSQQVLEYYSIWKLLANQRVKKPRRDRSLLQLNLEKYRLVNRLRKLSKRNLAYRREEQKQGQYVESKAESNLGQYLERLIAARIAQVALEWRASSVTIPDLGDMREYIESTVQARAKQLFPNHREQQKNYAKQFRIEGHRWSYAMLAEFICSRTLSEGITVETGRQSTTGNLVNKALNVALSAHSLNLT
ncbi:MAG TPA: type V CRISPR-associated protein Cas12k [Coleofasciculaceae cyanobacterium]|jgi:hypothetical protein